MNSPAASPPPCADVNEARYENAWGPERLEPPAQRRPLDRRIRRPAAYVILAAPIVGAVGAYLIRRTSGR